MQDALALDARLHRIPCVARFGLGSRPGDPRFAWRAVFAVLLAYAVAFACFYPSAVTNDDEAAYIRQARLALEGRTDLERIDPLTDEILFGKLENGGTVTIGATGDGLTFAYEARPGLG